jgi:hypothetical protein
MDRRTSRLIMLLGLVVMVGVVVVVVLLRVP